MTSFEQGCVCGLHTSKGGVPKRAVLTAVVRREGIVGDVQRDVRHHGGPERAVCILAQEIIDALREAGHPIEPGSTGENVTVRGIGTAFEQGTRLTFDGGVELEITQPAAPCSKIRKSFHDGDPKHLSAKQAPHRARYYAKVVSGGELKTNASVVRRDPS